MNATTESADLITCKCNHCDGHIQFDRAAAGTSLQCPHCGMDTTLYVPEAEPSHYPAAILQEKSWPKYLLLASIIIGLAILVGLAFYYAIKSGVAGIVFQGLTGVLVILAAIFVFCWALLWILFPVFVYFALQRMNKTLDAIESNTRTKQ